MKSGVLHIVTYFYRPLFWTLLFVLCTSFTQTEDVAMKQSPATIKETLITNQSISDISHHEHMDEGKHEKSNEDDSLSVHEKPEELLSENTEKESSSFGENIIEFGLDAASQNVGIPNDMADAGQIATIIVDTADAELRMHVEKASQEQESINNKSVENQQNNVSSDTLPADSSEQNFNDTDTEMLKSEQSRTLEPKENLTEEIPSFNEWTQKQLEEAEKKREEVNTSLHHQTNGKAGNANKVRSKNYASPDCGAKIVASNPEALSPSSVLSPSRDEYKLNTCTSRIWFIVELCEAIQAKKIDLANFELFSSSPKDFSVSVSDRFPSREWSNVGQFAAKDERDVQSFDLHPHLFGKYIKLEMHSHHGSEHFCPISLFRVYGTSEFEVLEKEDQPQSVDEEDDEDTLDPEKRPRPKNLFTSATDAVISIVKKAAEVLGNKGNATSSHVTQNESLESACSPLISTCTTPSHLVVCDNCSDVLFGQVFEILSCYSLQVGKMLAVKVVGDTIYNTTVCNPFGLSFAVNRNVSQTNVELRNYVKSFFPKRYLAALCNTAAVLENKIVLNVSKQFNVTEQIMSGNNRSDVEQKNVTEAKMLDVDLSNDDTEIEENGKESEIDEEFLQISNKSSDADDQIKESSINIEDMTISQDVTVENSSQSIDFIEIQPEIDVGSESNENIELDRLISDLDNNRATPSPPKESVFLRLSNRIKTLERNMSLSSQYLEELSRRYKKQVEEMVRLLETTITNLNEENKKKDERNDKLEARIDQLTEIVEALVAERDNSFNILHWLMLFVFTAMSIFTFCRRNEHQRAGKIESMREVQRRKSIDVVNHNAPPEKERRPSEEALKIGGTYEHLMLDDVEMKKAQKRRRKKCIQRSNSMTTLSEELNHQTCWKIAEVDHLCGLDDAPIVLEESENNPLQDMPLPKPLREERSRMSSGVVVRKISSPAMLKAVEVRKKTKNSFLEIIDNGHKKSASVDETKRQSKSPTPSDGNVSLGANDKRKQKREKKAGLKKFFRRVF